HMLHGVTPDMMVLGKAMGNGFPISAVIGKRAIMQAAQDTFISSTYWTERVGFTAALEVIRQFEKRKVIDYIVNMGDYLMDGLKNIMKNADLNINIVGLSSVPIMVIKEKDPLVVKTVFTQEMLKKGFLASNVIYVSSAHTKEIVDKYLNAAKEVFEEISGAVKSDKLNSLLDGEVCHSGFKRLA
ncbi:MAG: aminotransferase class III-fold pyridoxal phosphate-dependent enzyme, partial [Candidatus Omnitrophota bacterium]